MDSYLERKMQVLNASRASGGYPPYAQQDSSHWPNRDGGYGGPVHGPHSSPAPPQGQAPGGAGQMYNQPPHGQHPKSQYPPQMPPTTQYGPAPGGYGGAQQPPYGNAGYVNPSSGMGPGGYNDMHMYQRGGSSGGARPSITLEQRLAILEEQVSSLRQQNQLLMKYMNTSDAKIVELHNELSRAQARCDSLEHSLRQQQQQLQQIQQFQHQQPPQRLSPEALSSLPLESPLHSEKRVPSAGRRAGQIPSKTVLTYDQPAGTSACAEPPLSREGPPSRNQSRPSAAASSAASSASSSQQSRPEWKSVLDESDSNTDGFGQPPPLPNLAKKNALLRTNKLRQAQVRQADAGLRSTTPTESRSGDALPPSGIPHPTSQRAASSASSSVGRLPSDSATISSGVAGKVTRPGLGAELASETSYSHISSAHTSSARRFAPEPEDDERYQSEEQTHDRAYEDHDNSTSGASHSRRGSIDVTELDPYGGPEEELDQCPDCGRRMRVTALQKHIQLKVCTKVRKEFDVKKMRLQGVVSEQELRALKRKEAQSNSATASSSKKQSWKEQHEEFIRSIRYGKMVAQAQKEGIDLRTLPPPPPTSEASDTRIQCPYCERKFAEGTAERHIEHCKNARSRAPPPPKRR